MSQQAFSNENGKPQTSTVAVTGFQAKRRFYDDINFPKGFRRCGDFTSKEADLLEQYGQVLKDLAEGKQLPATADEAQFVEVASGRLAPSSLFEHLWVKYCKLAQGKPFYAVVGTVHAPATAPEPDLTFDDIDDDDEDAPADEEELKDTP
ncbi:MULTISPECIES: DUF413 domain-containing protein [Shewanella]|uniref:Macrodomain Ori protein n=2 Tax=Shewanella TaxID=22 RepID=A0A974XN39_9GAMM|nr:MULTISPECIES: DUF413 domain-containing protein [Shewanella]QSX31462.1 DUF413 domain-containing protein [Shewanella cyperi]QSX38689.1 DUF413 domain-containing protein [Shewanella sedimentimangrovi]QSX42247.1 DUF413 domain-containing protein [Shewanella cyperi]